jgi:propanediol utilization protein
MKTEDIKRLVETIVEQILGQGMTAEKIDTFPVEASGRHVHLSEDDALKLFGTKELTQVKELSQPGQFLCAEKVMLVGPKVVLTGVAVLGPCRTSTQVEVSRTDARTLGLRGIIRDSGDLHDSESIVISAGGACVEAKHSVIAAKRHIHMRPSEARALEVKDKDIVSVKVTGERPLIFEDVLVRVKDSYRLSMHIDYDEANAVGLTKTSTGKIIREKGE